MDQKEEVIEAFDIPVAIRKYANEPYSKNKKKLILSIPFLILLFSIIGLKISRNSNLIPLKNTNIQNLNNHDHSILGHLPYEQISKKN